MLEKRVIMSAVAWNTGLIGPFLNIASYPGTPLRIMAGPGTGKTFAMMRKVARLLESGTPPNSILVVSFTRTAANDLIHHLNSLGSPGADLVVANTLHSLSFSLLIQNSVFRTTNRYPRPLMEFEVDSLVCDLADQFGGKTATKVLIHAFDAYWARLQHHQPGWPDDPIEQSFDRELIRWLTYHKAMLIGELIPRALDFIRQNPSSPFIPSYAHVLVDEYQDLNRADQDLIDAFARNGTLTVVGDEDQSIYTSLRFAQPEGITQFDQTHQNTHDEPLSLCKRCPSQPIQMANSLILHNHPIRPSTISPVVGCTSGEVYIVQHNSVQEEITNTAAFVDWYLSTHTEDKPGDILILSTRRLIGYSIRDELVNLGHDTQSFFTEECLEKPSAIAGFTLLTLLVKPDDKPALRAWLGLESIDWRTGAYKRICQAADANGITPLELLSRIKLGTITAPNYTSEIVRRFDDLSVSLQATNGLTMAPLIDILWPSGDLNCADIRGIALAIANDVQTPDDLLKGLIGAITQPELPDDTDDIIRVMSLHKSKGLTAKCVLVVGCVAGALPTIRPGLTTVERQKAIEEQRRLFYVAITRTKQTLVISGAANSQYAEAMRMGLTVTRRFGGQAVLQASPFLSELGPLAPMPLSGVQWRTHLGF